MLDARKAEKKARLDYQDADEKYMEQMKQIAELKKENNYLNTYIQNLNDEVDKKRDRVKYQRELNAKLNLTLEEKKKTKTVE